jgi:predicted signal transduction protein with EAL and GGDEF domain/FixJ family two-component response regulator
MPMSAAPLALHGSPPPGSSGSPTVLLVDDDEVNLLLTALALRERGFDVVEATGGEQALAMLGRQRPDALVLDAIMPGLDGFATCRAVRQMPGFGHLPVLMLTGLDDEGSVRRALDAGATDFLVKSNQWILLDLRLRFLLRASSNVSELARTNQRLARAQHLANMGGFDWRRQGGQLLPSAELLRMLGLPVDQPVTLRSLLRMVPLQERRTQLRRLATTLQHSLPLDTDVPVVLLHNNKRVIHVEAEPEFDEHGQTIGYAGIAQDLTDRHMAQARIHQLAHYDPLTGLPNRIELKRRAEHALGHAQRLKHPCALLLIDLDHFKKVNDTLGHAAGDELLEVVARRLRACVRHSEHLPEQALESAGQRTHRGLECVARLGGDEFVALLPEVSGEADAERVAERILDVMREPILVSGQECFVTASVGLAIYPRDGDTVADLLRNADIAMYAVKTAGRNDQRLFSPHLAGKGREKLELESALHKALERNELVLHYQPRVDVRTSRMVGVEALMRWQRGDRLVPPGDFIALAEETGLIVPMTEWALREAARQAKAWKLAFGFDESISVNLPARMFLRSDLPEHIHQSVTAVGLPHRTIMLEIVEHDLMDVVGHLPPMLERLNQMGVEVAIDDFGTGESSLGVISQLPFAELKIDRQFVKDLGFDHTSSVLVTAVIAMARALRQRVVAEGVETMRQMQELSSLGCTLMQGFLFSKALPGDEVQAWLEQNQLPRLPAPLGAVPGELDLDAAPGLRIGRPVQR